MFVSSLWLTIVGLFVVSSLLLHVAQRARIRQLESQLQQHSNAQDSMPQDQLAYLRELAKTKDKVAAIKALRKQYPELSLVQAVQLWQQK